MSITIFLTMIEIIIIGLLGGEGEWRRNYGPWRPTCIYIGNGHSIKKKITIETLIEEGKYIRCWHRASIYIKELILGISH